MSRLPRGIRPQPARHTRTSTGEPARARTSPTTLRPPRHPDSEAGSPVPDHVASRIPVSRAASAVARIHTDAGADELARNAGANAVTVGRDIYFASDAYQPSSARGDARIAHELTHVEQYLRGDLAGRSNAAIPQHDRLEREAARIESGIAGSSAPIPTNDLGGDAMPASAPMSLQPCVDSLPLLLVALMAHRWSTDTEIDLEGRQYLPDLPNFCAYLLLHGPSLLRVKFGSIARGQIALHYGSYGGHHGLFTNLISEIVMHHPALPDVDNQRMAIAVEDDEIFGVVGRVGDAGGVVMDTLIPLHDWQRDFTAGLLELPDYRDVRPPLVTNEIDRGGNLSFSAVDYDFNLPGPADSRHAGKATLKLNNSGGTVLAQATLQAPNLGNGELTLHRLPNGSFTGTATMSVGPFGDRRGGHTGFSGTLRVTYGRRVLDITGTVRYDGARISGTGTLRLTDASSAWTAVTPHIQAAVGTVPPTAGPITGMALTGWGTMEYRFGDWLRGRALVVVAPDGHIYSRGEIRPTANIRFLDPPIRHGGRILGPITGSIDLFEMYAVNIEGTGSVELRARTELGPGRIHRLNLIGAFSTNTAVPWQLQIGGTLSLAAMAALDLHASVALRGRALHLVTVTEVRGSITGTARVDALAEATVSIGRRLATANPEDAEYFIKGNFGAYALLAVGLRGSIHFEAFGAEFKVWESAHHEWTLGDVGLEHSFDYVLGTAPAGHLHVDVPQFDAHARALIDSMGHDRPAPRNARGGQYAHAHGRWREHNGTPGASFDAGARTPGPPAAVPDLPDLRPVTVIPGISPPPNVSSPDAGGGGLDAGVGDGEPVDASSRPLGSHGAAPQPPAFTFYPDPPRSRLRRSPTRRSWRRSR